LFYRKFEAGDYVNGRKEGGKPVKRKGRWERRRGGDRRWEDISIQWAKKLIL